MDLEVVGRHALLFDDDATATFVNSKKALVEWNSLFIDRYDVRHLLSNPPSSFLKHRQKSSSSPPSDSHLESELDLERYVDLPSPSDEPVETDTGVESAGYHAVPFSYGNNAGCTNQKNADVDLENAGFHPHFPVPESLLQHLPPTEKVHQIIARTAMFVSKHGGQSEIVLRVKQGDNPAFGFLMPHHHLHPYFRYLVDHQNLLKIDIDGKSHVDGMDDNQTGDVGNGGALSLLGSIYGGEDEDVVVESATAAKQMDSVGTSAAGDVSNLHHAEQKNPSRTASQKEEAVSKLPHPSKDKAPVSSKQRITGIIKAGSSSSRKNEGGNLGSFNSTVEKSKSLATSLSKVEMLVIEPPSDLKRLVDRIVEIILKNGKEFEAVLIEQDKKHRRFPFLLPSSQYHSYYLKVLRRGQESKLSGKNPISEDGPSWQVIDKKSSANDSDHDLPHESDRKEKFKMVIGKSKKDTQDQPSKGTQQQVAVGVDAAAAAAILQAATRGIKNASLEMLSKIPLNGHHGIGSEGQASSFGSQPQSSIHRQNEGGQPSVTVPIAKEIAKTAALAAAGEADSSEAGLTREQKLKAERLKRAKMFAAMIKRGTVPSEKDPLRGLSVEPLGSGVSGSGTEILDQEAKGKEESSVPPETGISDKAEISGKKHSDDGDAERRSRKNRHYRLRIHEDEEAGVEEEKKEEYDSKGELRHSRKKHKNSRPSHHHRDHSKHRKRHSSTRSKESRHRHKRDSSSEDMGRHHRHKHESSEDEHRSRLHRHETSSEDEHQRKCHRHKHDSSEDEHKKRHQHKHRSSEDGHQKTTWHKHDSSEDEHKRSGWHKHESSSENEHRKKSSRHKHDSTEDGNKKSRRRKHESSSEDEHQKTNHRHKHDNFAKDENGHITRSSKLRKRSHSEEGELEEGEIRTKISEQSPSSVDDSREASVDLLNSNQDKRAPSQPLEPTEVSDDLRAKIRAMLLATL
ncbi:hypothetical protein Ancab_004415 [Ancistrocladus abbreviatus]